MRRLFCIKFMMVVFIIELCSQGVGIGTNAPHPSAILDISSTTKGILFPRMTTAERDQIASVTTGLTILNLDDYCFDIFDGVSWIKHCGLRIDGELMPGNKWLQKSSLIIPRSGAVGFSIGNKGYVGTGELLAGGTSYFYNDFWEYDPSVNKWTQRANFIGGARAEAVGFSMNNKGYIGTGREQNGAILRDFYQYDPVTNIWSIKANIPGYDRYNAVGFSIGSKGYIGYGRSQVNSQSGVDDFYEFDANQNIWTPIYPIIRPQSRFGSLGFSIGNRGYVGFGWANDGTMHTDIWEYNQVGGTWTNKGSFPNLKRAHGVGFSIGTKGYFGTGNGTATSCFDFYEYDPQNSANPMTKKADFYGGCRYNGVGFSVLGKGYIGTGKNNSEDKSDFWEYNPEASFINAYRKVEPYTYNGTTQYSDGVFEKAPYNTAFSMIDRVGIGTKNPSSNFGIAGGLTIDENNISDGLFPSGLQFGSTGTGEGIVSKRTANGNQYGLDLITAGKNRLSIKNNGQVHINGINQWDLANSDGDFSIGNDDYRIEMGIALSGSGGGIGRIRSEGGVGVMILGAGPTDVLTLRSYGRVGIGEINPSEALHVNGNILATGTITQNSDARLKQNIRQLQQPLELLKKLNGYEYYWKDKSNDINKQIGLIAQEVKTILPNLVKEDNEGIMSINYISLIPLLLEAIKEQQVQIDDLKKMNSKKKKKN